MRAAANWIVPVVIAVITFLASATETSPSVGPAIVFIEIDDDAACRVEARVVECGDVGPYLRDTLRLPDSTDLHLSISRKAHYETAAKLIESLQRAGFHNLGFVADVVE